MPDPTVCACTYWRTPMTDGRCANCGCWLPGVPRDIPPPPSPLVSEHSAPEDER